MTEKIVSKIPEEAKNVDVSDKENELVDEVSKLGEGEKLKRLRWSVAVRYLMISVVAILTIVCYELGLQFDLIGVLIATIIAFVFNLTSNLVYRDIKYPKFWPYIGVFLDMIVISLIVHATGGIESIFLPLYLLQLVGTNVHFSKMAAPMNLIFGGGMFVSMVILEYQGVLPHNDPGIFQEHLYLNELYFFSVALTMISMMGISSYRSGYVVSSLKTVESELLKANRELLKLNVVYSKVNRRLKEIDQMKTEFISVASHQMRTPLSAVKWVMRMVLDEDLGPLNSQQKEMLSKGYQTNERMISLINDLLNVSRIEEGRFQYRFVHMSIEEVIESVSQELYNLIKERNIKFKFKKLKNDIPKVNIDPQKIRLVIQNLIDNAIKFTTSGGKVTVTLDYDKDNLYFSVIDSGVGIPTAQQNRIFSKFFRADNVVRMQTDGSGLGLFIVRNVIKQHQGRVWFESIEGKGTTFKFSLPMQQAKVKETQFDKVMRSI
ncbi:MAG: sensor histidine kinase [Candidatus Kerfeldbacteria bacterium]